jgi:murein DD-endopeptidase MepM/ murein hydrolase activator NlpD
LIKEKYKLVILKEDTFEEKISFTLSLLNVFVAIAALGISLILITLTLIVFTPLREYIPGYADISLKKDVVETVIKIDSLESALRERDIYLANLKDVINGKAGIGVLQNTIASAKSISVKELDHKKPKEDSLIRTFIENNEEDNFNPRTVNLHSSLIEYKFLSPVKGTIISGYNLKTGKLSDDISMGGTRSVNSVLNGVVLFSGVVKNLGVVLIMQHENNIISVYEHCAASNKKAGNYVVAGEEIALASSNPNNLHQGFLSFGLWYNGSPVDPKEYIKYN